MRLDSLIRQGTFEDEFTIFSLTAFDTCLLSSKFRRVAEADVEPDIGTSFFGLPVLI